MLLLEVTTEQQWRYALTRQTKWGLRAQLDDQQVWECAPYSKAESPTSFVVLPQLASPVGSR
jgi:hypothetical protein